MSAAPIRLLRAFATVGGWTMASRVLGFLRDIMIAALAGTGPVAVAFFVAFRLPNMFRRFFAEGAFNMAFVPLFARTLEGEGRAPASQFASEAASALLTALLVLTALAQLAMPAFVWALASGLDEETFDLAVAFSRICFAYIVFISLAALVSGIMNGFGRFAAAAAAPALLNVVLIGAMTLGWAAGWNIGLVLSWGVFLGGMAQLALVVEALRRIGFPLRIRRPRLTPGVHRLVQLGIPGLLAGGVTQINLVVGTQIASYTEGAVGWLWIADRIYQLPLGVIGVAIGVVLLPELARRLRAGEGAAATDAMNRAAEVALALTLPAAAALVAIPGLITEVLFERGAFTAEDTAATALALAVYALGLPAFVLLKVLQPAFFAREDTRTPLIYAAWSMLANVAVALACVPVVGWLGAAIGAVAAGWLNLALLWRGVRALDGGVEIDARLGHRLPRIAGAAAAMGLGVGLLSFALDDAGALVRAAGLGLIVTAGMAGYAACAMGLGALSPAELRRALGR